MKPGLTHDAVEESVVVRGIVMKENQTLYFAFTRDSHRLAPSAMPPASLRFVLFRRILGIVNQHVCALRILAQHAIHLGVAVFEIAGVDNSRPLRFKAVPGGALRVIHWERMDG